MRILCFTVSVQVLASVITIPLERQEIPLNDYSVKTPASRQRTENLILQDGTDEALFDQPPLPLHVDSFGQYIGTVFVGTPKQPFRVLFDTMSANFWVASSKTTFGICKVTRCFDADKSLSYNNRHSEFNITYRSKGFVSGNLASDILSPYRLEPARVDFVEATNFSDSFFGNKYDGIFGLGLKDLAVGDTLPPFYQLISARSVAPMFSFYITDSWPGSQMVFGGVKNFLFEGYDIKIWLPVIGRRWWQVALTGFAVYGPHGDKVLNVTGNAVIATGQSFISVPAQISKQIYELFGAAEVGNKSGGFAVPCSTVPQLPKAIIYLNELPFELHPSDYITRSETGECMLAFSDSQATEFQNTWFLGHAFMKKYYTAFDLENRRVGLALAVHYDFPPQGM